MLKSIDTMRTQETSPAEGGGDVNLMKYIKNKKKYSVKFFNIF